MKRTFLSFVVVLCPILLPASYAHAADDDATKAVLTSYEKVRAALASDNLDGAKQAAAALTEQATAAKNDRLAKSADALAKSSDVETARNHFKVVSQEVIPMVKGKAGYYVITCSMANASWVQTDKAVQNPYYGKQMLKCGVVQQASSGTEGHGSHSTGSGCGHGCGM